jgi:protoporphyrinogen oxidase
MKHKYLIIGAGPAGLGAAYRLKELGIQDFLVLEQLPHVGGLATTYKDDKGFLWDIGGHVQFSHYKYFDKLMQKALGNDGWLHHERESWVWIQDRFVPYPFQNNLRYLPTETQWACVQGLVRLYKNPPTQTPKNFAEWVNQSFGEGLAEVFMRPYNFKVWAHPLEQMSYSWIGERVALVDLERTLANIYQQKDDISWGPNNTFQFPKNGGTGAIWEAVGNLVGHSHIHTNTKIIRIDTDKKIVHTSDGRTYEYEHLLSTLPVDILSNICQPSNQTIIEKAAGLKYSSTNIIGIGLKGRPRPELASKCWMYFPESDSPFYRTTVFSNYSPNNVPDISKYWSLMTETSESQYKPVNQETILEETIQGLLSSKLIESREQIVSTWTYRAEYGYPTPSVERDAILKTVIPYFESLGIHSRGRFGAWKYEVSNQDHTMMQGVEWANKVVLDIPEITFPFPNTANANWGK